MRKNLLFILLFSLLASGVFAQTQTAVWNPAANPESTGLWSEADNWTSGTVPEGDYKVVFNVPGAMECILDEAHAITQLVMGENADGGRLVVQDGGELTTGATWSAVGYNDTATLIVETGGVVNFGQHLWVGFDTGGDGVIILDGGTINVAEMTGLGWNNGDRGTVHVNSGMLNLGNLGDNSIKDGSVIDIVDGTVTIDGDKSARVNTFADADKITANGGAYTLQVAYDDVADETVITALPDRNATTVWNPAANPESTGMWTERMNWTDKRIPYMNKVVFNVPNAMESIIDSKVDTISQLVMGDNDDGGRLVVQDGGELTTNADWSAVGYSDTATLIVETGGVVNFMGHMWVGLATGGDGVVILDGGTINVGSMTGLGWGDGDRGTVHVNSGMLNLANLGDNSIKDGSVMDIVDGTVTIDGDKTALVKTFIDAGKITGNGGDFYVHVTYDADTDETVIIANTEEVSSDATLSDLSCDVGTLAPDFDPAVTEYTLEVPEGTTTVTISATANHSYATVAGAGDVDVSSGSATADIVVTAEDGSTQTYSVDVTITTVSVFGNKADAVGIYPNPASERIYLKGDQHGDISVYNAAGRLVSSEMNVSSMDVSSLESGLYIVKIRIDQEVRIDRFIIE